MPNLLGRAVWDADAVRDELRAFVVDELGDRDGVIIVDFCRPRDYAGLPAVRSGDPLPRWASRGTAWFRVGIVPRLD